MHSLDEKFIPADCPCFCVLQRRTYLHKYPVKLNTLLPPLHEGDRAGFAMPPHPWLPPAQKPQLVPSSRGVTSPASRPPGDSRAGAGSSSVRMQSLPCLLDALPSRDST